MKADIFGVAVARAVSGLGLAVLIVVSSGTTVFAAESGSEHAPVPAESVAADAATAVATDAETYDPPPEWELIRRRTIRVGEWDAERCRLELDRAVTRLDEVMAQNQSLTLELNTMMRESRENDPELKPLLAEMDALREQLRQLQLDLNQRLLEIPAIAAKAQEKEDVGRVWQVLRTLKASLEMRLRVLDQAPAVE